MDGRVKGQIRLRASLTGKGEKVANVATQFLGRWEVILVLSLLQKEQRVSPALGPRNSHSPLRMIVQLPPAWVLTHACKVLSPGLVHATPVNGEIMRLGVICISVSLYRPCASWRFTLCWSEWCLKIVIHIEKFRDCA